MEISLFFHAVTYKSGLIKWGLFQITFVFDYCYGVLTNENITKYPRYRQILHNVPPRLIRIVRLRVSHQMFSGFWEWKIPNRRINYRLLNGFWHLILFFEAYRFHQSTATDAV